MDGNFIDISTDFNYLPNTYVAKDLNVFFRYLLYFFFAVVLKILTPLKDSVEISDASGS